MPGNECVGGSRILWRWKPQAALQSIGQSMWLSIGLSIGLLIGGTVSADEGPGPERPFVFALESWNTPVSARDLMDSGIFETDPDRSDIVFVPMGAEGLGDGFVQRIRGWIEAPTTGAYRFGISADDDAVLLLSPEGDPASAKPVAKVTGFSTRNRFDGPGQVSGPITLVKGQRCFVEARHRDGAGEDHLTVAWKVPRSGVDRLVPIGCVVEPEFLFEAWPGVGQADPGTIKAFQRPPGRSTLVVDFATPADIGSSVATRLTGTWVAPRDGEYRFLLSADDRASLEVRSTGDSSRLLGTARLDAWTSPDSWDGRAGQVTDGIRLKAGQKVRLELLHSQGSGPGHAALGVVGPGLDERPITSRVRPKGS